MQTGYWEFYASLLGKKYDLSLGMPPFMGSKYLRKKDLPCNKDIWKDNDFTMVVIILEYDI